MFNNIGRKIKGLAEFLCGAGIFGSNAAAIIIAGSGGNTESKEVLLTILIAVGGSLLSWIGSFVLYGFGQLVENSDIIVENCVNLEEYTSKIASRGNNKIENQQK